MDINAVILGFLEWRQLTGYELKKMFADLSFLPWSGNNNQIYKSLLELEREGLLTKEVIQQENLPAQKRYSATEQGRKMLKEAVLCASELPEQKNDFLLHMVWAQCLTNEEIGALIHQYQNQLFEELAMTKEKMRRKGTQANRSEREAYIFDMIWKNQCMVLQNELNWLGLLQNGLVHKDTAANEDQEEGNEK